MGTITANTMITANGVAEAPERWHFAYASPQIADLIHAELSRSAGLVLGRRTYEEFAGYWPHVTAEDNPMAPAMNSLPKFVVSNRTIELPWQPAELLHGDVAGQLHQVAAADGDLSVIGSPTLVRSLLDLGAVDRLSLLVFPVVVPGGRRLFDDVTTRRGLKLTHIDTLPHGVMHVEYQPADA